MLLSLSSLHAWVLSELWGVQHIWVRGVSQYTLKDSRLFHPQHNKEVLQQVERPLVY